MGARRPIRRRPLQAERGHWGPGSQAAEDTSSMMLCGNPTDSNVCRGSGTLAPCTTSPCSRRYASALIAKSWRPAGSWCREGASYGAAAA